MIFNYLKAGYQKVYDALSHSGSLLGTALRRLFSGNIDDDLLDKLEQLFYEADLGVKTSHDIVAKVKKLHTDNPTITADEIVNTIRRDLTATLSSPQPYAIKAPAGMPHVILIVGVNGNGKTTAVAKLAKRYASEGKKVLVAAADTFRAAAVEQLEIWSQKIGVDIVKGAANSDPAAVVFDALSAAKARAVDVVIIDTAGRLHTKTNLMQELEKIRRTCLKVVAAAPHETLLVLDANQGQNGVDQAHTFNKSTPLTGLILTKLDGRAKGGSVISIHEKLKLPVKYIGVGEGADDLKAFDPDAFVAALLS